MADAHSPDSPRTYRAYRVAADGRLTGVPTVLEAQDDADAIVQAEKLVDGTGIEVWERARCIVVLPPKHGEGQG